MTATDILIPAICMKSQDGPVGTTAVPQNLQKKYKNTEKGGLGKNAAKLPIFPIYAYIPYGVPMGSLGVPWEWSPTPGGIFWQHTEKTRGGPPPHV